MKRDKKIHTLSTRLDDDTHTVLNDFITANQMDYSTTLRLIISAAITYGVYQLVAEHIIKSEVKE